MATKPKDLEAKIRALPDNAKLEIVDSILTQLDKPDPEIDRIWTEEARNRWKAYKAGKSKTISYEQVMKKYSYR